MDAKMLVTLACPLGLDNLHYAPELVGTSGDERIRKFVAFGKRLVKIHQMMKKNKEIMTEDDRIRMTAEARRIAKRRIVKFNGGKGAILCSGCRTTIKTCLTKEELEDPEPMYCGKCQEKLNFTKENHEVRKIEKDCESN